MRLIKIELKNSVPFWSIDGILLTQEDNVSDYFDIDDVPEETIKVIESSKRYDQIRIFDRNNNQIDSVYNAITLNECLVDIDDIQEEVIEEIQSVTVPIEENIELDEKDFTEEALVLINKNGNTLKKIIKNLNPEDEDSRGLLLECINLEKKDKNRSKIIKFIKEKIKECI